MSDWTAAWERDKYEVGRAMHEGWKRQKIVNGFADHPYVSRYDNPDNPKECTFRCCPQNYNQSHHPDMIDWDALPESQQAINFEGGREGFRMGYESAASDRDQLAARLEAVTAALEAADDMARVLDQDVMPRYMEMIEAFALGDSVVDPMVRQALDVYRDRRILAAGQTAPAATEVRRGRFVPRESDFDPPPADNTQTFVCTRCADPISDGYMVGDGDGTGQRFAHPECYREYQDTYKFRQPPADPARDGEG